MYHKLLHKSYHQNWALCTHVHNNVDHIFKYKLLGHMKSLHKKKSANQSNSWEKRQKMALSH